MKKLAFISILLFLISCHSQKEVTKQPNKKSEVACKPMPLLTEDVKVEESDLFNFDSLAINNDCLEVFVNYSGGCGEAVFELYYTNKVMHSMPPQTVLFLDFKDEDPCRAIVSDTLYFDLSNFDNLALSEGIWLRFRDSDKTILYKSVKVK